MSIKLEELERVCRDVGRLLAKSIAEEIGAPAGFVLIVSDFGDDGSFTYVSNVQRADVVRLLKEARDKIAASTQ